ncbi:MAG: hypothetical protein LBT20_04985 [Clostridiales bacterium]|jgi:hypothetical protein|nr:hypothetical protein [Clostridiales bacterium]
MKNTTLKNAGTILYREPISKSAVKERFKHNVSRLIIISPFVGVLAFFAAWGFTEYAAEKNVGAIVGIALGCMLVPAALGVLCAFLSRLTYKKTELILTEKGLGVLFKKKNLDVFFSYGETDGYRFLEKKGEPHYLILNLKTKKNKKLFYATFDRLFEKSEALEDALKERYGKRDESPAVTTDKE